jgi:hypothetical protein
VPAAAFGGTRSSDLLLLFERPAVLGEDAVKARDGRAGRVGFLFRLGAGLTIGRTEKG